MTRSLQPTLQRSLLALACMAALSGNAFAQAAPAARILSAAPGQALTLPSQAAPAAIVASALRTRGGADLSGQLDVRGDGPGLGGLRHVRLQQQVNGVPVHGATVKATLNARGELLHLIDRSVDAGAAAPVPASIGERQALDAALARVHPGVAAGIGAATRDGLTTRFAAGAFFHNAPEVSKVLLPQASGGLAEGFLVQTWTQRQNLLDHTVVDGSGNVVSVERRTQNDSYNVFVKDPIKTPQAVVQGPGAGNAQSPSGWLAGTQTTFAINGNNVSAYLDADGNNRADKGGTAVSTGNFLTTANLATAPTTTTNKAVAVQNLFYLNNVIHDILYRHGFNEAAGNFQTNNFNKGGRANDPVNAEAQDGSGTDNANFSTPADGQRPRMQMYLWTGAGPTHELVLAGGSPVYGAVGSSFGAQLTTTGISFPLAAGLDTVGTLTDACEALQSTQVTGKIVLVDRGTCAFTVKVKNAQLAGAKGVIIANNDASRIFGPGGTDSTITIPSMMISQADGADLRTRLAANPSGTMRKKSVQPLQIDASLDTDVVFHEYGHGLSWRMIGGMSGPLAGALGEGASDVVAFMVNGDDVVGEYSASDPLGIRRYRYAGYPLTYKDVTGAEVHNDGEIYAAAMWRLRELWLASGRSNDTLFDHFVDGMNYTPSTPAFEDMRKGMLQSIAASAGADAVGRCALVWQAFAQYGIGAGAKGTVLTSTSVSITPSATARSDCTLD